MVTLQTNHIENLRNVNVLFCVQYIQVFIALLTCLIFIVTNFVIIKLRKLNIKVRIISNYFVLTCMLCNLKLVILYLTILTNYFNTYLRSVIKLWIYLNKPDLKLSEAVELAVKGRHYLFRSTSFIK